MFETLGPILDEFIRVLDELTRVDSVLQLCHYLGPIVTVVPSDVG